MNTLTDTVIPGNHGKIFGTDAIKDLDLLAIKTSVMEIDDIQNRVKHVGFHAIPKDLFAL